ncbi:MAG TPA: SulP family inorganic anion transporter, partial [Polyangiaceae bacterium]|nr:SulP family inorganic anion transporter [Polyangiaceae bacterium]
VILAPIATQFGLAGLLTAGFIGGMLLVAAGAARLGRLIEFIPYPVTTGFTAGIATVIATLQLKDFFGLQPASAPAHFTEKVHALWQARDTASVAEVVIAVTTLTLLLYMPRVTKKVPAPLIAIVVVAVSASLVHHIFPQVAVATIGTRFHTNIGGMDVPGIPRGLPMPGVPWGDVPLTFGLIRDVFPAAFTIAMLGAIESLLSAVIADGMTGTKHEPNSELVALGIGNMVAPIFGGIAATGALARTATNIRAGARSPFSAIAHSIVLLLAMLALAPLLAYVPMASLAALMLLVAWNMSEARHFLRMMRAAARSDVTVLVTCYLLTVFFDMVVAVSVGVVLAAMLFMRRMAELTTGHIRMDPAGEGSGREGLPRGVALYEIDGPLFFGAAQNAMRTLSTLRSEGLKVLVLALGKVPTIDATGLVALESAIRSMRKNGTTVVLAGPLPHPRRIIDDDALRQAHPDLEICANLDDALDVASAIALGTRADLTPAGVVASQIDSKTVEAPRVRYEIVATSSSAEALERATKHSVDLHKKRFE